MAAKAADATRLSRIERAPAGELGAVRVKDLALEQLKHFILSGAVAPGQRLPSERELAERLGVGRNSVREALKALEAVGMVVPRVGDGTFITAQPGASIGRAIGLALAAWGGTIVELLEARRMMEVEAARAASQHATDEDLAALTLELDNMDAAGTDIDPYLAADMNFHRLVARATHNTIVAQLIANLIDLMEEVLIEARVDQLPLQAEGTGTHRKVFDAISQRQPEIAAEAMRQHLEFSRELWQTVISLGTAGSTPPAVEIEGGEQTDQ